MTSRLANKLKAAIEDHRSGNLVAALKVYDEVLARSPDHADALHLKGLVAFQTGGSKEAEASIRRAIDLRLRELNFRADMAVVLIHQERINEAEQVCRQVLRIDQAHVPTLTQLGESLRRQRRSNEALQTFRTAADSSPGNAAALCNVAATLNNVGRFDEAHDILLQARDLAPSLPEIHINLASAQRQLGDHDAALISLDAAEHLHPCCEVFVVRGDLLLDTSHVFDAVEQYQAAISHDSSSAAAVCGLGRALQRLGHWEESLEAHRLGALTNPSDQCYQSNYLYNANLSPLLAAADVHQIHSEWGQRLETSVPPHEHPRSGNAERTLRVGYVSPDFGSHATMRFLYPILESHDRNRFEIFCYSETVQDDYATAKVRSLADRLIPTRGLDDDTLARQILNDRIDILVDIAGHTAGNRLPVFARKSAPVQISFLGYPTTTGLTRIDYFLSDAIREPDASSGRRYSEQLILLPHGACCFQASDAPDVTESPFQKNGYMTLGSTLRLENISPQTLHLWANVLSAVPDARLFLFSDSAGGDESQHQHVFQSLLAAGINTARVTFGWERPENHLELYSQIDILLDVFSWDSGTVPYDAMWMAVPIPAAAGDRGGGRATASLLHHCGLPELIANSDDDYVKIVSRLAADTVRLRTLRRTLRSMMENTVCNATRFTRDIEAAYRLTWRRFVNAETPGKKPLCVPGEGAAERGAGA